jgi:hypothetical protein
MSISGWLSWFRRTESRACVPQAFWIVCDAKKRDSAAAWSNVPAGGCDFEAEEGFEEEEVGYLKRKMTP